MWGGDNRLLAAEVVAEDAGGGTGGGVAVTLGDVEETAGDDGWGECFRGAEEVGLRDHGGALGREFQQGNVASWDLAPGKC